MDAELSARAEIAAEAKRPSFGRRLARNWFAIALLLLFMAPAASQLLGLNFTDPAAENRTLAAAPAPPRTLGALVRFPDDANAWLVDWFGLRQPMVRANDWLRFALFREVTSPHLLVGKHGRVFMTSPPGRKPFSLVYDVCGVGPGDGYFLGTAYGVTALIDPASRDFPNFTFLIVPGATMLYSEDLPRWAWTPCRQLRPSVERMMDHLADRPDILAHIVYPIDALQALKLRYPIIPKRSLHWAGEGALRYVELLCEQRFGLKRVVSLPTRFVDAWSDLNQLNPGLALTDRVAIPDLDAAGVLHCSGAECPPLDPDPKVTSQLDRYRAPAPNGKRLLIIGDSFADNVAGDFTEYFGEVWHIHFNGLEGLTRQQLDKLVELAFRQFRPDQVIYICNDFGIFFEPVITRNLLWPDSMPSH